MVRNERTRFTGQIETYHCILDGNYNIKDSIDSVLKGLGVDKQDLKPRNKEKLSELRLYKKAETMDKRYNTRIYTESMNKLIKHIIKKIQEPTERTVVQKQEAIDEIYKSLFDGAITSVFRTDETRKLDKDYRLTESDNKITTAPMGCGVQELEGSKVMALFEYIANEMGFFAGITITDLNEIVPKSNLSDHERERFIVKKDYNDTTIYVPCRFF
ncbi:MAG: hypothetical protein KAI18_03680 [Candidatus Aenigmarchaeota archaeon]|nr:hypothetical protein [Candidatus Aenigmarchaeota archaeon]